MAEHQFPIATSSIEGGLDFACNLVEASLADRGDSHPGEAPRLLRLLGQYISFRYAGELGLALEWIALMGHAAYDDPPQPGSIRPDPMQFWAQVRWVAAAMHLDQGELARLAIPSPAT